MTPNTSLNILNNTYNTEESMDRTVVDIHEYVSERNGTNYETAIAFGHSMGGITVRQLDFDHHVKGSPRLFSGMVTSGTSNLGAVIVNSLDDGTMQAFFNDGCKEAVADPFLFHLQERQQ